MRKNNYFSAQEAKQQIKNGDAFSKNKKRQAKLLDNIINVFYKKIKKAVNKGELEITIKLGYIDGVLITRKYWDYHFDELSDESRKDLSKFFKSKGFDISFFEKYIGDEFFVTISWKDNQG